MLNMIADTRWQQTGLVEPRIMSGDQAHTVDIEGKGLELWIAANGMPTDVRQQSEITASIGVQVFERNRFFLAKYQMGVPLFSDGKSGHGR